MVQIAARLSGHEIKLLRKSEKRFVVIRPFSPNVRPVRRFGINPFAGQKRQAKSLKDASAEGEQQLPSNLPTRHSMTSGSEHNVASQKTWSVPSGDEKAGRGGTNNAKPKTRGAKKSQKKPWASGANAVAVG